MKPRKRSKPRKPRAWRVWVQFVHDEPLVTWRAENVANLLSRGSDVRLCEIREVPKRRKARRKK